MTFAGLVDTIIWYIDKIFVPFLYLIAFLMFIFGIFKFFFMGGEENRKQGREFALWGLIGFVVLFGVWSIVSILLKSVFP